MGWLEDRLKGSWSHLVLWGVLCVTPAFLWIFMEASPPDKESEEVQFLSKEYFQGWLGEWIIVIIGLAACLGLIFLIAGLDRRNEEMKDKKEE